jgi:ABC-type uncharacterized transport system substrate-binding protein
MRQNARLPLSIPVEMVSELVPQAYVIGLLVNPNLPIAEGDIRSAQEAARATGVQLQILKASTESEIDAAFANLVQFHSGALVIATDAFFNSRRASSSWRWQHAMPFQQSVSRVNSPPRAA